MRIRTLLITITLILSQAAFAGGDSDALDLKYPELMVSPSASKRLEMEFANEKKAGLERYMPTLTSSSLTMLSAFLLTSQDASMLSSETQNSIKGTALASMLIGGSWIAIDLYLNSSYKPYETATKSIGPAVKGASQQDTLARERLAEEALYNAGDFNKKLKWLSVATNLVGSGLVLSMSKNFPDYTTAKSTIVGLIGVVAAFAPVMFESPWEQTANYHRDYKKRIYGPLTGITILEVQGKMVPAYAFNYTF